MLESDWQWTAKNVTSKCHLPKRYIYRHRPKIRIRGDTFLLFSLKIQSAHFRRSIGTMSIRALCDFLRDYFIRSDWIFSIDQVIIAYFVRWRHSLMITWNVLCSFDAQDERVDGSAICSFFRTDFGNKNHFEGGAEQTFESTIRFITIVWQM